MLRHLENAQEEQPGGGVARAAVADGDSARPVEGAPGCGRHAAEVEEAIAATAPLDPDGATSVLSWDGLTVPLREPSVAVSAQARAHRRRLTEKGCAWEVVSGDKPLVMGRVFRFNKR